jgi:hypothetical protein
MNRIIRTRRALLVGSMLLTAPTVILGAILFNVSSTDEPSRYVPTIAEHHARFVTGGILLAIGTFLFIPSVAAAMRLAQGRGGALVTAGAVATGVAAAAMGGGDLMLTSVLGMLTTHHTDLAIRVDEIAQHSPLGSISFSLAPLFVIGSVLLGSGLLRAGLRPTWVPILLIVGAVAVFAAPDGLLGALLHAPIAIAVAALGVLVRRTDDGLVDAPMPVPRAASVTAT